MEAHFHKDYKIEEKDLIPDNSVYAAFPASAVEGTRIAVETSGTFTFYQYLKGTWRKVGGSGMTLKKYQTVNANSMVVSGLDLDADKIYKIFVKARDGSAATAGAGIRLNGDSALNYFQRDSAVAPSATSNTSLIQFVPATIGISPSHHQCELLINKSPGISAYPMIQYQGTSTTTSTGFPNNGMGSAVYNSTTNVTSITFLNGDTTTTCTWDVWIYKLETS